MAFIYTDEVQKLYIAYYGRPADPGGQAYWVANSSGNLYNVMSSFGTQTESTNLYAGMSTEAKVNAIYWQIFGRAADVGGLTYWAGQIASGKMNDVNVAKAIMDGAQDATIGGVVYTDATCVANKLSAANSFTAAIDTTDELVAYSYITTNSAIRGSARGWLATVNGTATSVTAAAGTLGSTLTTIVAASVPPVVITGQTFTLTTATDSVAGSSGNDTIIGDYTADTIQASDQIIGGAGIDTFKIYGYTGVEMLPASLSGGGIEVLDFRAATDVDVNVASISGVTSVVFDNLTTAGGTTKLGSTATLTLSNNTKANITGAIVVDNGSATAATLILSKFNDNAKTIDFDGASGAVKTLNIQSTGGSNTVTIVNTDALINKLVVTGDASLKLSAAALPAAIVTVDASASTGGVNVLLGNGNTTDTGGSGNDRFAFAANQYDVNDKVTGGAGTDTLAIADLALNAALTTAVNAALTMETLEFTGAGGTVDAATVTAMANYNFSGAGAMALSNALSTTGVTISVDNNASTFALSNKIGETTANLTLTDAANSGTASLTGISILNIVSTASSGTVTNTIKAFAANSDNMVLNVTGSQALTIAAPNAVTTGVTINGSAATGVLTLTGTTKADILKGGSAKDVFNASTGADLVTGGAGADTFKFAADATVSASSFHTITDYETGVDKLVLVDKGTEVITTTKVDVSAAASLSAAIDLCMTGDGSANGIVKWFQYGTDTYVVEDMTAAVTYTAATDIVVKLTGLVDMSGSINLNAVTGNLSFA